MAFVENDGAQIYWHQMGRGTPIVLVMGLGCCSAMWFRLAPRLARTHRVIMLDNRGVGNTRVTSRSVTHRVRSMAKDVTAVLDAAEVGAAHVLGFSMGGMITQQMAISHPERMLSMTLLGTSCGGFFARLGHSEALGLLFRKGSMTAEDSFDAMQPYVYAKATPADMITEDKKVRLANMPAWEDFRRQLWGLMSWSSYPYLQRIDLPTLVMHGIEDALVPPENGRLLAKRIANAEHIELEDASHWAHTDKLDEVCTSFTDFIASA